jgi:hypothetical protein
MKSPQNYAMAIVQRFPDASPLSACPVSWPIDDYVLHMVLRQGRMINKLNGPCLVEAIDFSAGPDGRQLVFHMSALEASQIADEHAAFETTGLLGRYKFSASTGLVKLVSACTSTNQDDVKAFLLDPASHELIRTRYARILEQ